MDVSTKPRLFCGGLLPASNPRDQLANMTLWWCWATDFLYYAHVPGHPIKPGIEAFPNHHSPLMLRWPCRNGIVGNLAAAGKHI